MSPAPAKSAGTSCSAASTSSVMPAGSAANTTPPATPSPGSPGDGATASDPPISADRRGILLIAGEKLAKQLRQACEGAATTIGIEVEVKELWYFPPAPFDAALVAAVRGAAAA